VVGTTVSRLATFIAAPVVVLGHAAHIAQAVEHGVPATIVVDGVMIGVARQNRCITLDML